MHPHAGKIRQKLMLDLCRVSKAVSRQLKKHILKTFENYNFTNNTFNFHFNKKHIKFLNLVELKSYCHNNEPNNFCGTVSLLGQSQICATFLKMCAQMNSYFLFKIRDTTFCKKITKTGVSLVKKAQNYTSITFIASCKRL